MARHQGLVKPMVSDFGVLGDVHAHASGVVFAGERAQVEEGPRAGLWGDATTELCREAMEATRTARVTASARRAVSRKDGVVISVSVLSSKRQIPSYPGRELHSRCPSGTSDS